MMELEDRAQHTEAFPDVTPLLDVVFILLIFFVISAAFALRGVDLELPQASETRQIAGKALHIELAADGALKLDGLCVATDRLGPRLQTALRKATHSLQIVLKASPKARVGDFIHTVDTIRTHGGRQLVIATKPSMKTQ
jgi:biopolymer transport protein ExbD